MSSRYDVFTSYPHKDANQVRPMVEALRRAGLRVWIDKDRIEDFKSIQGHIENGLAKSKVLLAWYSVRYPPSRACQWELTTAFLAAQQEGDVRRRILLINPEDSNTHIYPVELCDAPYQSAPDAGGDLQALAAVIKTHVAQLTGVLGEISTFARPDWYGGPGGYGSNRFVGRVRELWAIHSGLQATALPVITGRFARPLVRLVGLGGAGKSLLAEEYALRFGAAYPGGVLWLKAYGHDATQPREAGEREEERQRQFAKLAESLGIPIGGLTPTRVRAVLAQKLEQRGDYLWVVDDLPSGMLWDDAQDWLAPSPCGHTLVTTRIRAHGWAGTAVEIDELEPDPAYVLLTHRRPPKDKGEKSEARALANDLSYHALALELAAAMAQLRGYAEVRRKLRDQSEDVLNFAAELFGARGESLPQREGININISRTLLVSIEGLSDRGMDFLRLAAQLAPTPISRELVALAFAAANESDPAEAENRADLARAEVESRSLAQAVGETGLLKVHTFVSRTVRFRDTAKDRHQAVRRGAAIALIRSLEANSDEREHARLAYDVEHARATALLMADRDAELDQDDARLLVGLVRQLDRRDMTLYTDVVYARALRQKVFEISHRMLGEHDLDTLIVMNDLGVLLCAYGVYGEAQALEERVLEISRLIRGEAHVDTVTAMMNLLDTLNFQGDYVRARALQEKVSEIGHRATGMGVLRHNPA